MAKVKSVDAFEVNPSETSKPLKPSRDVWYGRLGESDRDPVYVPADESSVFVGQEVQVGSLGVFNNLQTAMESTPD